MFGTGYEGSDFRQTVTIKDNHIFSENAIGYIIRIAGWAQAEINGNKIILETDTTDPVIYCSSNQKLIIESNQLSSGTIRLGDNSTPGGLAFNDTITDGMWVISKNILSAPGDVETAAIYISSQSGMDLVITDNLFHLTTNPKPNKTIYFHTCTLKNVIIQGNNSRHISPAVTGQNGTVYYNTTYDILKEADNSWN